MNITENETGYKIYWEDMNGKRNQLFTSGLNKEQAIAESIDYIRNQVYLASFTIVGLEQWTGKRWEKVEIKTTWCKGR